MVQNPCIRFAIPLSFALIVATTPAHAQTYEFVTKWGNPGISNGQFYTPYGVAVDSSGNVYVVEYANARIQKFDASGTFLTKWGVSGAGDGQFDHPQGLAVDGLDNVYVADTGNNRMQKFDSSGMFLTKWGSFGSDEGQFIAPRHVAVDSLNNVFVAESGGDRIQVFRPVYEAYAMPVSSNMGVYVLAVVLAIAAVFAYRRTSARQP